MTELTPQTLNTVYKIALTYKAQRDSVILDHVATSAAFAVYKSEEPTREKAAYRQGKKDGRKTGLTWGLVGGALIPLIPKIVSLFR